MESYKIINRELIDSNQEMKQQIAAYQRKIVDLEAQLMEQITLRAEREFDMKRKFLEVLRRNYELTIREIDPKANIFSLFSMEQRKSSINSLVSSASGSGRGRSSEILDGFRRSLSLNREYNSAVQVSPTRRSGKSLPAENSSEFENDEPEGLEANDTEEQQADKELRVIEDIEKTLIHLELIEEEEVNDEEKAADTEDENEEDLLAQLDNLDISVRSQANVHRYSRNYASPLQDVTNQSYSPITKEKALKSNVAVRRGKRYNWKKDDDDNSIEGARLMSSHYSEDLQSTGVNELTMANFVIASCSTPVDNRTLVEQTSPCATTAATFPTDAEASNGNLSRPRRKCAPKNLTEVALKQKLRNENEAKKHGKKKKSTRKHK